MLQEQWAKEAAIIGVSGRLATAAGQRELYELIELKRSAPACADSAEVTDWTSESEDMHVQHWMLVRHPCASAVCRSLCPLVCVANHAVLGLGHGESIRAGDMQALWARAAAAMGVTGPLATALGQKELYLLTKQALERASNAGSGARAEAVDVPSASGDTAPVKRNQRARGARSQAKDVRATGVESAPVKRNQRARGGPWRNQRDGGRRNERGERRGGNPAARGGW